MLVLYFYLTLHSNLVIEVKLEMRFPDFWSYSHSRNRYPKGFLKKRWCRLSSFL